MVFHQRLSDGKSFQVSRTFLSILADLNNAIVWILPSLLSEPSGTVFNEPMIIGITVTLMFHNFFSSLVRSKFFSLFSLSLIFTIIITQSFLHQRKLMVFHWRLSDSKSLQVSRILLSILAVFSNAVWMVSTWLPTSKSSRSLNTPLVTMPKAPITIGIIVTFMFHRFFNSQARSRNLSLFSHSFSFILWSARTAKLTIFLFFCWLL